MADPNRLYRRLLKLYPARFREEYGAPLERQFADEYSETRTRRQRAAFWARTLRDLLVSAPGHLARELSSDVRYAIRVYARRPVVSLLALAALALAIGATTGVFSVVNALLLRSLPFRESERLVQLEPSHGFDSSSGFLRWHRQSSYLQEGVIFDRAETNLGLSNGSVRVAVAETSSNFFFMLGSEPIVGRGFASGEDVKGKPLVAVIGYGVFQQLFGGDVKVLGSTIHLNGQPVTVIGVARPGFDYPSRTMVWTPTVFDYERLPKTGVIFLETIGRLKQGVSLAQANAMFEAEHANDNRGAPKGYERPRPRLVPLREQLAGNVRQASLVMMGAVAFILLIACANVANLLLTRVSERRTELTIRATLGASRARLVQQLVTESLTIALLASIAGLVVAAWAARLATAAQPAQAAFQQYSILDVRVLGFAVTVAVLAAVVFGVVPATMAGRLHPAETLARHQAGDPGAGAGRLRRMLLAGQAALTVVLLAGSMVMGRAFVSLVGTDLGFRTRGVVSMNVSLAGTRYQNDSNRQGTYFREALSRLRAVPGVVSAAGVDFLPLASTAYMAGRFSAEAGPAVLATVVTATPDYFRTMGTAVVLGREFSEDDRPQTERVAIVNEAFAREAGGAAKLVGKLLVSRLSERPWRVVGVVRGARYRAPSSPDAPQIFIAAGQRSPTFMTLVARVDDAGARLAMTRDAVQSIDVQVPVFGVRTLDDYLRENLAKPRFYTETILFLGAFALLLSVLGVYAVSSYSIAQRTHEIGVRMAIGASNTGIRSMLMRQSLVPVAAGALAGIPAALGAGRYLSHLVSAVRPPNAVTCAAAALGLALVASAAVWSAIGRIARSNPLDALRSE